MNTQEERIDVRIESTWKQILQEDFKAYSFRELKNFLLEEKELHTVYPPGKDIFNAFNLTPFPKVKVVIIGQDPYHGKDQAHGLCFSVRDGIRPPPSLKNIFKELHADLGVNIPESGDLTKWAEQGILLLNATLTVRASQAGSHQGKGWEEFTDSVIRHVSKASENVVFLLWGRFAQAKSVLIDEDKHLILKSTHPSPFSAHQGFLGCRHFSKVNEYLRLHGKEEIDWDLTT